MSRQNTICQHLDKSFSEGQCEIDVLRLDLYDMDIPGNKYWKLKYNIEAMTAKGMEHMVSFGGAFSNHIAALAAAGKKFGFKTTGIIRGEELSASNPTLKKAQAEGMELKFVERTAYRNWKKGLVDLNEFLGMKDYYLLPEGGTNTLAVKGCSEIADFISEEYDLVCCPVGSGGTLAGLIAGLSESTTIFGFSSLKGGAYMEDEIRKLLIEYGAEYGTSHANKKNWKLIHDYHFGGFAKVTDELIEFYKDFLKETKIELDLVYTAKMMFGLKEMIREGKLEVYSKVLAIHTGGQQGNRGFQMYDV